MNANDAKIKACYNRWQDRAVCSSMMWLRALQAGCGLRCSPEADIFMGGATAPQFFPDRFDGHGYAA